MVMKRPRSLGIMLICELHVEDPVRTQTVM